MTPYLPTGTRCEPSTKTAPYFTLKNAITHLEIIIKVDYIDTPWTG